MRATFLEALDEVGREQLARLAERNHECEGLGLRKAPDMAPAHEPVILFPPGRSLVGRIGNDPGRPEFANRTIDNGPGLARRQHQLAVEILTGVIGVIGTRADVDERRDYVCGQAVLRE